MRTLRLIHVLLLAAGCAAVLPSAAQDRSGPYLSTLHADADDPLFATYAAPTNRSQFVIDEGYHFQYYLDGQGVAFTTDSAGLLGFGFQQDDAVHYRPSDMAEPPIVTASYNDLVRYHFRPFGDILVEAHFQVYSSQLALYDIRLTNTGTSRTAVVVLPYLAHAVHGIARSADGRTVHFEHEERPDDWILAHDVPFVGHLRNVLLTSDAHSEGSVQPLLDELRSDGALPDSVDVVAYRHRVELAPGASRSLRIVRGVDAVDASPEALRAEAESLLAYDIDVGLREAEERYVRIPRLMFNDPAHEATYWNAFSLMEQVMLPAEGESSYNYYVFSREPTWGWGHGGQVFHESLTMLAYAFMDPDAAMNSQRVYMERQHDDGYINYRTGSFLNEIILHEGERTTSAPWFNWINWELYRLTDDRAFLQEAYASGAAFYEWLEANRDGDSDGLAEWGGHAIYESVRDHLVAVWDRVGWPGNFESVALNSMLVMEARSLAAMAHALGDANASTRWTREADRRTERVRSTFWDEESGFFYNVDRDDHDFTYETRDDLKRQEIIGFLPLWAGIATEEQARRLVGHLMDPETFGRPYGVPSLAADDPYYDPMGYWNGPVWVEWQYLVFRGLLDYGHRQVAEDLSDRVIANVAHHLTESHTFWELYSPDSHEAGDHQTYIWTGLVARMMLDLQEE